MPSKVSIALTFVLCLFLPHCTAQSKPNHVVEVIRKMQSSTVQIRYTPSPPGSPRGPGGIDLGTRAGTGFFVGKQGYVLTAGHVVRMSDKQVMAESRTPAKYEVAILIGPKPDFIANFRMVDAVVVDVDDVHDLALLKLSKNPFAGEVFVPKTFVGEKVPFTVTDARLDNRKPPEGETLLVSGYPLDMPTFVTQRGMVASESFLYVDFAKLPSGSAPPGLPGEPILSILLDAVLNPGNSGGPVYSPETGDVIGVDQAYKDAPVFTSKTQQLVQVSPGDFVTQNSGLALVIPAEYAVALLRKNKVADFSLARANVIPPRR